ncbi:AJAP1 protein, partial [Eurystomus gularis]|nr:AJAP1 protein [Eurystomus gularis]
SLSVHRSGCPLGSHAWILIAMFHLAMDLASCQPPASGTSGRLSPRPALRHRLSRGSLWVTGSGEDLRRPSPPWTCTPEPDVGGRLGRVLLSQPGVPAAARGSGWSRSQHPRELATPREPAELSPMGPVLPGLPAAPALPSARALTKVPCPGRAPPAPSLPLVREGTASPRPGAADGPALGKGSGWGVLEGGLRSALPEVLGSRLHSLSFLFSAGLAVHQIITITVSLIMVIAALITTLVLKNCCAQSGRPRRNSHQRKLDQQEESCQNLTDFAPARVPSALDIFTAYNETLQCSHECVRTPVPVYAEEALRSPGDYKTTFNGNRPSSSDRHLIPVAFVSEKWFEISC